MAGKGDGGWGKGQTSEGLGKGPSVPGTTDTPRKRGIFHLSFKPPTKGDLILRPFHKREPRIRKQRLCKVFLMRGGRERFWNFSRTSRSRTLGHLKDFHFGYYHTPGTPDPWGPSKTESTIRCEDQIVLKVNSQGYSNTEYTEDEVHSSRTDIKGSKPPPSNGISVLREHQGSLY